MEEATRPLCRSLAELNRAPVARDPVWRSNHSEDTSRAASFGHGPKVHLATEEVRYRSGSAAGVSWAARTKWLSLARTHPAISSAGVVVMPFHVLS